MNQDLSDKLHNEGLISDLSFAKIKVAEKNQTISVHWEVKTMLYLGVLLLAGGLGILIYKNIDTIGHTAILAFISLVCAACFYYCFKNKLPFSTQKVASPNAWFDYILLLGCSTLITLIAYLQFQYNLFGTRYGLALCIPMLVLFFSAYFFDHLGILTMAITNLAAWVGITVTPMDYLSHNDFDSPVIIITALALGVLLLLIGWASQKRAIKKHFEFTYNNFGTHLVMIAILSLMFYFNDVALLYFLLLAAATYYFYRRSVKDKSFYFILTITLYAYIGLSYVVIRLLDEAGDMNAIYLGLLYFIASAIGLILFLIRTNKKLKTL